MASRGRVQRYWPGRAPLPASDEADAVAAAAAGPTSAARPYIPISTDSAARPASDYGSSGAAGAGGRVPMPAVVVEDPEAPVRVRFEAEVEDAGADEYFGGGGDDDEEQAAARAFGASGVGDMDDFAGARRSAEGDEDESEEGEEGDSDEDDDGRPSFLMKPVFVPKQERETIAELEAEEQAALAAEELAAKRAEERREEARRQLIEAIQREEEEAHAAMADEDLGPPDTDGVDEEEYAKWKVRELRRIKREKDEREQWERERAETERRRHLTDAELIAEDKASGKRVEKPKAKWNFLQRYYHKGAFYLNDEQLVSKAEQAADAPTLEDRVDKAMLPKVLQVRNFGRPSRTKWTHLLAEDTTQLADRSWLPYGSGRGRGRGTFGR